MRCIPNGTRLLDLNVRAFLGVRGRKSVNAGLRRTLLQEPGHFLAYNNGIVATVDDIEIVTTDTVKYELDKSTGILKIDRPQKFSNTVPALYGFVPRTFCGDKIAAFCMEKSQLSEMIGDGDPIDILVLTEHQIAHGDIKAKS